jgi:radical SAM superfamily enzyme YgiQ (UPF0313 family)
MDENFLLQKKRALELLDCMKKHDRSWTLYVFSSANAIRQYDIRQLVEMGIGWVWLGLESPRAEYSKLHGIDTLALTRELQSHGIRVLGSTIVGLEHHTPENIGAEIEHAVSHAADCHQFMLYTPVPGTPLYDEVRAQGRVLPNVDLADIHGQYKFNFRHAAISRDQSKSLLDWAFQRDFERNGPSLFRLMRTMLQGWQRYRSDRDPRVRERIAREVQGFRQGYGAALWAMERYLRGDYPDIAARVRDLRLEIERELGGLSRFIDRTLGPLLLWTTRREARFGPTGRVLEPPTFLDRRNWPEPA